MKKVTITALDNSRVGGFSNTTIYSGAKKEAAIEVIRKEPAGTVISIDGAGMKNLFYGARDNAIHYLEGQTMKKNPAVRLYDVYVENEKTGETEKLNATPMTHKEAVTFKSKFTPRSHARYFLEEVKKNPVRKPSYVYAVTVTQKGSGKRLYLESFASGYDANIMQPVFTDEKERALAFDHATAKGAAWALGKVLHKHKFFVSAITAKK